MISKVKNVVIFGAGYVLGAQAGRARYEELKEQATRVMAHPKTQQVADQTRRLVTSKLPSRLGRRSEDGAVTDTVASEPTVAATVEPNETLDLTEPAPVPPADWQSRP